MIFCFKFCYTNVNRSNIVRSDGTESAIFKVREYITIIKVYETYFI